MLSQDIVKQLAKIVPLYTDGFSQSVGISDISMSGAVITVTTDAPHGLIEGQNIAISGIDAPVTIDVSSFIRTGSTATFETLQDHDLTLSQRDIANGGKTVTLSGANESEFNGTFQLIRVLNRRKLMIAVDDSGPTAITGSPIVENANGNIFNGFTSAVNITLDTFEYSIPDPYPVTPVFNNASVQVSIRILSVLDVSQYLQDIYTRKGYDEDTLVVQLGDVSQSKRRDEPTDANSSTAGEMSYCPTLIQPFSVYIVMNVTDELTGSIARDKCESEYIPAIFRSVLRAKFKTGFTYDTYRATFTGHGVYAYSDVNGKNKAIYAHEVSFEQLVQMTKVDMFDTDVTVAMRDIDYKLNTDIGNGELTAGINLDEEPIP